MSSPVATQRLPSKDSVAPKAQHEPQPAWLRTFAMTVHLAHCERGSKAVGTSLGAAACRWYSGSDTFCQRGWSFWKVPRSTCTCASEVKRPEAAGSAVQPASAALT